MNCQELSEKAYQIAFQFERDYGSCSQATLKALQDVFQSNDSLLFRAAGAFTGGGACEGDGSCGAFAAAALFIGTICGRDWQDIGSDASDPAANRAHELQWKLVRELHHRFIQQYGSIVCHQIQRNLFGRPFYTVDPDQLEKLLEAGGHDWACTSVAGNAARWTAELLYDICFGTKLNKIHESFGTKEEKTM